MTDKVGDSEAEEIALTYLRDFSVCGASCAQLYKYAVSHADDRLSTREVSLALERLVEACEAERFGTSLPFYKLTAKGFSRLSMKGRA